MRGFVATPAWVVDQMVERLLDGVTLTEETRLLDPGCGDGALTAGVLRYSARHSVPVPHIDAVEFDPIRVQRARGLLQHPKVRICALDFLAANLPLDEGYDLAIGNPPYIAITSLDEQEKQDFRARYSTARGRFDLYFLFFERTLDLLGQGGRLAFITPEKYLKVWSAKPLRRLLDKHWVEDIEFFPEETFEGLATYPVVTTLRKGAARRKTFVRLRGEESPRRVWLPTGGGPWTSALRGAARNESARTLGEVTTRISCGVATGADSIFIMDEDAVPEVLRPFAHPTISGRDLARIEGQIVRETTTVLVSPYTAQGVLRPTQEIQALIKFLSAPERNRQLKERTCVNREKSPKPWFAFHETPPADCLKPKILCRDLTQAPKFWIDEAGGVMPRHSVYYIIPAGGVDLYALCEYLNGDVARQWLAGHSQRAANGFLRLQSRVMKQLPVPDELVPTQGKSE